MRTSLKKLDTGRSKERDRETRQKKEKELIIKTITNDRKIKKEK